MKKCYFIVIALFLSITGFSQAYEGNIQYDKKKQAAIVIDYAYPAEAVENAFIQKMEKLGYKAKEEKGILNRDKGFFVFRNMYVTDITQEKLDYIVKVERKSRKESDESVMYMVMLKDEDNALDKLDSYDIGRAKTYLNNMLPDIEAANLELQIKAQEDALAKAEKKLKNLQEDKEDLEKKLKANENAQDETIRDIDSQKEKLLNLKSRRKL